MHCWLKVNCTEFVERIKFWWLRLIYTQSVQSTCTINLYSICAIDLQLKINLYSICAIDLHCWLKVNCTEFVERLNSGATEINLYSICAIDLHCWLKVNCTEFVERIKFW
ncbi:unnamed protein product [Callosobruchus maculatus]|uniref:Uncharacterized protein n=1 Tax=Callosobruchus maculatus TaxID=64391 RepID=A0A653BVE5_CALMS|nr:unnamed protein product [Callosobruchus maculatus]